MVVRARHHAAGAVRAADEDRQLAGRDARRLLGCGVFIDLDPAAFATGSVAVTMIAHIGVILRQVDDAPTYGIAVFRSLGNSFEHCLVTSSALDKAAP